MQNDHLSTFPNYYKKKDRRKNKELEQTQERLFVERNQTNDLRIAYVHIVSGNLLPLRLLLRLLTKLLLFRCFLLVVVELHRVSVV